MNPLEVLKLKPGSTLEDAKRQYRVLSLRYHPDKNPDNPSAIEAFRDISDSYKKIVDNPNILIPQAHQNKASRNAGYLIANLTVDISDVYLNKTKSVTVVRNRICRSCSGTGSSLGVNGVCELCKGDKRVKNRVSSLIGIKDECPACDGTGRKKAPVCPECRGSGVCGEEASLNFKISQEQYNKKTIVLKDVGNEFAYGYFGIVHVKLNVSSRYRLILDGDIYRINHEISPAQYAIGDIITVKIFGKDLDMVIYRGATEALIRDQRSDGIVRDIHVDLILVNKPLTPEIEKLYREILRLDKIN